MWQQDLKMFYPSKPSKILEAIHFTWQVWKWQLLLLDLMTPSHENIKEGVIALADG